MNVPGLLIFAYGNPSRGDDALGPRALDRLAALALPDVELLWDFQLQVEHALDLLSRRLVLFIDADAACVEPFRFRRLQPVQDRSYTTHAVSPEAVLEVYRQLHEREPPPSFLMGIGGETFELGEPLSAKGEQNLAAALPFMEALCTQATAAYWQSCVSR